MGGITTTRPLSCHCEDERRSNPGSGYNPWQISISLRTTTTYRGPAISHHCVAPCSGVQPQLRLQPRNPLRTRFQYVESSKQKKAPLGPFVDWWRRRESNPRPQIRCLRRYMLRPSIFDCLLPDGRRKQTASPISLTKPAWAMPA